MPHPRNLSTAMCMAPMIISTDCQREKGVQTPFFLFGKPRLTIPS